MPVRICFYGRKFFGLSIGLLVFSQPFWPSSWYCNKKSYFLIILWACGHKVKMVHGIPEFIWLVTFWQKRCYNILHHYLWRTVHAFSAYIQQNNMMCEWAKKTRELHSNTLLFFTFREHHLLSLLLVKKNLRQLYESWFLICWFEYVRPEVSMSVGYSPKLNLQIIQSLQLAPFLYGRSMTPSKLLTTILHIYFYFPCSR